MDRLISMRVFQRVIDEGGFAGAARSLEMSAAAVTRFMADLEQHLGVRLIQRTTRRLVLTEAGEAYLARVRSILMDIDEAEAEASASAREVQGVLRILATPVLASYYLAQQMGRWRRENPKVQVDLSIDPFPQGRIESFDVTFMVEEEGYDASVVARPLSTTDWIVCAAPDYLQRYGTPQVPHDLRHHDYLRFPWQQAGGPGGRRVQLWPVAGGEPQTVEMNVAIQSISFDVLYRAALDGAGIAMLSRLLVARHLAQGTLVQLLPDWIFGRYTIYAALPSRKLLPARVRKFLEFLAPPASQGARGAAGPSGP